jgi:hypothetical protein
MREVALSSLFSSRRARGGEASHFTVNRPPDQATDDSVHSVRVLYDLVTPVPLTACCC